MEPTPRDSKLMDGVAASGLLIEHQARGEHERRIGYCGPLEMLYDNALLSRVYLHAYQASGDPFFRWIFEETLDYVLRETTRWTS